MDLEGRLFSTSILVYAAVSRWRLRHVFIIVGRSMCLLKNGGEDVYRHMSILQRRAMHGLLNGP